MNITMDANTVAAIISVTGTIAFVAMVWIICK